MQEYNLCRLEVKMIYKPKMKSERCIICGKVFHTRLGNKHKSDHHIIRKVNCFTCSKKCGKVVERLRLRRDYQIKEAKLSQHEATKKAIFEQVEDIAHLYFDSCLILKKVPKKPEFLEKLWKLKSKLLGIPEQKEKK